MSTSTGPSSLPDRSAGEVRRVGVIGGGTMGTGIAYVFAAAGCFYVW